MYWSVEIEEMDERWTNTQHARAITALRQARNAVADGTTRGVWINQFSDNEGFMCAICMKEDMSTYADEWKLKTYNSLAFYKNPVDMLDDAIIKMQNGNSINIGQCSTGEIIVMDWEV
jgi:hypothetical protein